MSNLYVYLICSRNKDNKDIPKFKKRAKTILEYKENEDKVIEAFKNFAAKGVSGEQTRLYRSVNSRNEEKIREELIIRLLRDKPSMTQCQHGNMIFHDTGSTLLAYIPSLQRGHNIINTIQEENLGNVYDIEESDSEVLFKFKYADSGKIIPLLKPRTSGSNISPFSSRNLPQNKDYKISDEDLIKYKNIVEKIPSERILTVSHATNNFIKSLANRRKPLDSIKADMKLKGLRGKEYIHCIGLWDRYIKYLEKNL